jgi:hypothetical protein
VSRMRAYSDDPWLSGFIDGEGCFTRCTAPGAGNIYYYRPKFSLALRWDDKRLLERLRDELGGSVNDARNVMRGKRQPSFAWVLASRRDLAGLVAYLDRFPLRSRKAEQYGAWLATWTDYIAGGPALIPREP